MWRASELETLAKMYYLALAAGRPVILSDDEVARVVERFKSYGRGPEAALIAKVAPKKSGPKKKVASKTKSAAAKRRTKKTRARSLQP